MEKTFGALNKMTEGRKCGECVKNSSVEGFFFFLSLFPKKGESERVRVRERGGEESSQVVSSSYHGYEIKL